MNPFWKIITILVIVILLGGISEAFFFGTVCLVSGTISIHDQPAAKDLPVIAYIGADLVAQSTTKEDGKFELSIPQYDPESPDVKGYQSSSDIIQVKLNGRDAKPTFSPLKQNIKINLNIEQTLDVRLSTWGKIKALFK